MPIIDITPFKEKDSDAVMKLATNWKVLRATMCNPCATDKSQKRNRDIVLASTELLVLAMLKKVTSKQKEVSVPINLINRALDADPTRFFSNELMGFIDAGNILANMYIRYNDDWDCSLNLAIGDVLEANILGESASKIKSKSGLQKVWKEYKNVAHLIAAFLCFAKIRNPTVLYTEVIPSEEELLDILFTANELQKFGIDFIHPQGQQLPLLSNEDSWSIPEGFDFKNCTNLVDDLMKNPLSAEEVEHLMNTQLEKHEHL